MIKFGIKILTNKKSFNVRGERADEEEEEDDDVDERAAFC